MTTVNCFWIRNLNLTKLGVPAASMHGPSNIVRHGFASQLQLNPTDAFVQYLKRYLPRTCSSRTAPIKFAINCDPSWSFIHSWKSVSDNGQQIVATLYSLNVCITIWSKQFCMTQPNQPCLCVRISLKSALQTVSLEDDWLDKDKLEPTCRKLDDRPKESINRGEARGNWIWDWELRDSLGRVARIWERAGSDGHNLKNDDRLESVCLLLSLLVDWLLIVGVNAWHSFCSADKDGDKPKKREFSRERARESNDEHVLKECRGGKKEGRGKKGEKGRTGWKQRLGESNNHNQRERRRRAYARGDGEWKWLIVRPNGATGEPKVTRGNDARLAIAARFTAQRCLFSNRPS